jgi:hypothetical protein
LRKYCIGAVALLSLPCKAGAQKPQIQIILPERAELATEAPFVRSSSLLSDEAMRNLLVNGFPARLHYRIERWNTGGWFDDIKAVGEWDVVVKYDALGKRYHVFRAVNNRAFELGNYATLSEAQEIVDIPFVRRSLCRGGTTGITTSCSISRRCRSPSSMKSSSGFAEN